MPVDKIVAPLLRVPLFAGLSPLQITEIARHAERITFRRGAIITTVGAQGDAAYLIVSGSAERLPDPGTRDPPEPIESGSMVGEMAMLIEHIYGATVVATERVRCLGITRAAMHAQMLDDPSLAEHLQRQIAQRLLQVAVELRRIDEAIALSTAHMTDRLSAIANIGSDAITQTA